MVLGNSFLAQALVRFFTLSLSPQLLLGAMLFLHDPSVLHPPPFSVLSWQKQLPSLCDFSLSKFTSLHHVPTMFCGSHYADFYVNPEINFLSVQNGFCADLTAFQG